MVRFNYQELSLFKLYQQEVNKHFYLIIYRFTLSNEPHFTFK